MFLTVANKLVMHTSLSLKYAFAVLMSSKCTLHCVCFYKKIKYNFCEMQVQSVICFEALKRVITVAHMMEM